MKWHSSCYKSDVWDSFQDKQERTGCKNTQQWKYDQQIHKSKMLHTYLPRIAYLHQKVEEGKCRGTNSINFMIRQPHARHLRILEARSFLLLSSCTYENERSMPSLLNFNIQVIPVLQKNQKTGKKKKNNTHTRKWNLPVVSPSHKISLATSFIPFMGHSLPRQMCHSEDFWQNVSFSSSNGGGNGKSL